MSEFDSIFEYHWGWNIYHLGAPRWLWFSAGVDFQYKVAHIIMFGFLISWGRQSYLEEFTTFTAVPGEGP